MTFSFTDFNLKKIISYIDWKLLLFLLLFLNVKLAVKIPAIVIIYLLQFNFRFGFSFKNSRLPLFYLLIPCIAAVSLVFNQNYQAANYPLIFFTGIGFWLLCLLAVHQIKLSIEACDAEVIHNTVLAFFVLNAIFSFYNIAHIIWETGALNPYRYQGQYQKYFIGTGDYIKGLTFDTSTTNAVLNAFGAVYFMDRRNPVMVLICMTILLLTGSNFVNVTLLVVFTFLFAFRTTKDQKSLIVVCVMLLVVFMAKISPQSNGYVTDTFKNTLVRQNTTQITTSGHQIIANISPAEKIRQQIARRYLDSEGAVLAKKISVSPAAVEVFQKLPVVAGGRPLVAGPDINTPPYQTPTDTTAEEKKLMQFIELNKSSLSLSNRQYFNPSRPGKVIGFIQTADFLRSHPDKLIAGDGIGNFSSKLAFRATGLGFAGGFPLHSLYVNKDFLLNHLDLYLNYFSRRTGFHSLINSPYSVYDQMLGEYGVLGLLAFVIYYLWFFARHYRKLTYGLPVILVAISAFFIDYWFEQLSVLVFFELLLMLNIKETVSLNTSRYEHK